jgi:IS5 family transposase
LLPEMFGLSDPQLELQVADRISFRVFLGTTETNMLNKILSHTVL